MLMTLAHVECRFRLRQFERVCQSKLREVRSCIPSILVTDVQKGGQVACLNSFEESMRCKRHFAVLPRSACHCAHCLCSERKNLLHAFLLARPLAPHVIVIELCESRGQQIASSHCGIAAGDGLLLNTLGVVAMFSRRSASADSA